MNIIIFTSYFYRRIGSFCFCSESRTEMQAVESSMRSVNSYRAGHTQVLWHQASQMPPFFYRQIYKFQVQKQSTMSSHTLKKGKPPEWRCTGSQSQKPSGMKYGVNKSQTTNYTFIGLDYTIKLEAVCYGARRLVKVKGRKCCTQCPQDSVTEFEHLCHVRQLGENGCTTWSLYRNYESHTEEH